MTATGDGTTAASATQPKDAEPQREQPVDAQPQDAPTETGQPPESSPELSAFIATHCMTCAAGWTRTGRNGGVVVVCLLDRERVWPEMIDCDRYEAAEERAAPMATVSPETQNTLIAEFLKLKAEQKKRKAERSARPTKPQA